ncbi:hypothetical protein [Streptomyces sp. NPDC017435]|uniref:hypothetical protein n=1 Tax=Streptomyces sp. NPDC017435 TaxID=3364995 RepID=UPI003794E914
MITTSSTPFPSQADGFAHAKSAAESEFERRVQLVALGGGEELAGFVVGAAAPSPPSPFCDASPVPSTPI